MSGAAWVQGSQINLRVLKKAPRKQHRGRLTQGPKSGIRGQHCVQGGLQPAQVSVAVNSVEKKKAAR